MARERPPGDSRGTGDDPHRGDGFRPGREGRGRSRSGEHHGQRTNDEPSGGGRTWFPRFWVGKPSEGQGQPSSGHNNGSSDHMDGFCSWLAFKGRQSVEAIAQRTPPFWVGKASDGQGQPSFGHNNGSSDQMDKDGFSSWLAFKSRQSVEAIAQRVSVIVSSPESRDKLNTPVCQQNPMTQELPSDEIMCFLVHGPPVTRPAEIQLLQRLKNDLKKVQFALKQMGLNPVELPDVQIVPSSPNTQFATSEFQPSFFTIDEFQPSFLTISGIYSPFKRSNVQILRNTEAELERAELQKEGLVSAYEKFCAQFRKKIAAGQDNNECTPEFAMEMEELADCYQQNVTKALKAGGMLLTLKCFLGKIQYLQRIDKWFDAVKFYGSVGLFVVTVTGGAIQCVGTSPVQFKSIGNESNRLLNDDFTFDKLKLSCDDVSFGAGYQVGGQERDGELMFKCKYDINSFSLSLKSISDDPATDGGVNARAIWDKDIARARVSLDKLFGADTKCVLKLPYPSLNGKFEVTHVVPHAVYSGGVILVPTPSGWPRELDVSAVGGFKYLGFGGRFQLREGKRSLSLGMTHLSEKLAVGITYKIPNSYNATLWKKILDSSTTIAARASYKPQPAPPAGGVHSGFQFSCGLKHAVDPTLHWKARIGTEGAGLMVKKSSSDGKLSIKGTVTHEFKHPRRVPKMGVVFSFWL